MPVAEPAPVSHPDIVAALRATFGVEHPEACTPLSGGRSGATLLVVRVRGRDYVVRRPSPESPIRDPQRQRTCMLIASELGVTPPVHFADGDTGVSISDFIAGTPFVARLGSDSAAALAELAALIRTLHAGPAFPRFFAVPEAILGTLAMFAQHGIPAPFEGELTDRAHSLRAALAPHVHEGSCHFDLNPSNILYDGQRLWLIDWELASAGDRIQDLAGLGIFSPTIATRRDQLLDLYFGRPASPRERAHLHLSHGLALSFYGLMFHAGAMRRGTPPGPLDDALPDLASTLARIASEGTRVLDEPRFASVLLQEARRTCSGPTYDAALAALA